MTTWNLFAMILIPALLVSCATSQVGKRYPEAARNACPLAESCSLNWSRDDWAFEGAYAVDKTDDNRIRVHGRLKVDTTGLASAYIYSRVLITVYFFDSDEIVEELWITVRGKANRFSEFSKNLATDKKLDSSTFGFSRINVSEAPL